jgi:hypothetical protein
MRVRGAGRAGLRDALRNESSAERFLYASPAKTASKEEDRVQGEGSEVAAVRYDLEKDEGEKRKKKICCVCRACRMASAEPVCFGMMHLMQKFSREKYRRSPARGRPSVCCRP